MNYSTHYEAQAAADAESASLLKNDDYIDFDGQNCEDASDDVCIGWDGNDRRCSCGNRRVGWTINEYPKGVWSYYAEAY